MHVASQAFQTSLEDLIRLPGAFQAKNVRNCGSLFTHEHRISPVLRPCCTKRAQKCQKSGSKRKFPSNRNLFLHQLFKCTVAGTSPTLTGMC
jgi:hypothetical protein